jgi:hypothetical protein
MQVSLETAKACIVAMVVLYNIELDFDDNWEYEEENVDDDDDDSSDEDSDHHPVQAPPSILGNLFKRRFIEEQFAFYTQWHTTVFGLSLLSPDMVGDCFAEDSHFPPYMWAENSSSSQRTSNACEGFHSKFNASFYCGHPNIFRFIEVLKNFQIQINTYIKT